MAAQEALLAKLVNRVVPGRTLLHEVDTIAAKIASYKTLAVRNAKQALIRGRDLPLNSALEMERRLASIVFSSRSSGAPEF